MVYAVAAVIVITIASLAVVTVRMLMSNSREIGAIAEKKKAAEIVLDEAKKDNEIRNRVRNDKRLAELVRKRRTKSPK